MAVTGRADAPGVMGEVDPAARPLQVYVPRLAVEWLSERPDLEHLALDGTMALADISGFTALTERLARHGKVGAEEMSDILSDTFAALFDAARPDGADLIKWGGDAILLLFRGPDHAAHAVRAAHRMRMVLRSVGRTRSSAGRVTLRMSVGIHSGLFHFFLVGDPALHRELVVCGPSASTTAEMESLADGRIVVSDATAALLHPTSLGLPVRSGRVLRSAPVLPDLAPPDSADHAVDVRRLLPPQIRAHLLAAAGESEHRQVAVAFIQFSQTDAVISADGPSVTVAALDECLRNIQEACAAYDVSFIESDINRDGGKVLLAAGAPRSGGSDDDRLLRAVQLAVERGGRLPLRAGVNHGRVFAGDFGPAVRRTYSIKGDAVNVAARVMAHAETGETLATQDVMSRSRTAFVTRDIEPFMVKGKAQPIHAVSVGSPAGEIADAAYADDTFIGRDTEMATLRQALNAATAGQGSLIEVIGEPGMGKTRLVQEVLHDAAEMVVVSGPSSSYDSKTPYVPFRTLLRELLGVGTTASSEVTAQRLKDRLATNTPQLLPWLPLLGIVLNVDVGTTNETDELDERFRGPRLAEVLVEFLQVVLPTPTLLVFENTHLMDDASAELLRAVAADLDDKPWVVLATRRDVPTGFVPTEHGARYRELLLTPMDPAAALQLLDAATNTAPLSAHVMNAIAAKAAGNPLFLRALVTATLRSGSEADLPDSVEALLTAEVDHLDPSDRTVLRCAAVLGVQFAEALLRDMLATSASMVAADLHRLSEFVYPDGVGMWRFRHALIRDAAYAGLPYRLRRRLHDYAGRVIESTAPDLDEVCERLSLHFFHAGDMDRAWTYCRMAGRRAQAQYAYTAAIGFLERAIESKSAAGVTPDEIGAVHEALGDVRDVAGFSRDAVVAYRRARPYRRGDLVGLATLMLKEAGVHQRLGSFVTSLRLLSHARGVLADQAAPDADAARSRLATRYAFGRYLQGERGAALRWSEIGVREARASGDQDALAFAYNTRHLACIQADVAEEEAYGELALAIYERLGNLRMQAHCLNNLAISALQEGRWDRSAAQLDRAADLFRRVGDTANEANAQYNRADLLIRQRRFAQAEPLLATALRAAQAADDRELVALVARETGQVLARSGRVREALSKFDAARAGLSELGLRLELISLDTALADCLTDTGDVDRAIVIANEAVARAEELHADSLLAAAHRVRGCALLAAGRDDDARAAFEEGLRCPAGGDGRHEYALNLLGLARLAERHGQPEAPRLSREGNQILDALGVVATPASVSRR